MFAEDLIFTLRVVDGETTPSDHAHTILRLEAERANGGTEHHASDLCTTVFEGEVHVAGVPHAAVRQLPLNPHVRESVFEQHSNLAGQLGDRKNSAPRRRTLGF